MLPIRIVAIPTEVAEEVRSTMRSPVFGFPAHGEVATDAAPCRHCLRTFIAGKDRRILFTYNRFTGMESLPQPGPIYVHAGACDRYSEDAGFPEELRRSRARWKPMREAGACSHRNTLPMAISSRSSKNSSSGRTWTIFK